MKRYQYQNLYKPQYNNFNMKLIATAFLAVIAMTIFAGLAAAEEVNVDLSAGARVDSTGVSTTARAEANTPPEVQEASRMALDPQRAMAVYGMFRSRLAHYILEQCSETRGMERLQCFERILKSNLPAELREGADEKEASDMHERMARGFGEFAKRTEHRLAARACFATLTTQELLTNYPDVQGEVEARLSAYASANAERIAALPAEQKVELQTSAGATISVPKAVLARAILVVEGKDSALAQKCRAAVEAAKAEAKTRFDEARDEFKQKLSEFKEAKQRGEDSAEQHRKLAGAISALIDARIRASQKFEAHGASSEAVAAFVASMEAKKTAYLNASFDERKEILHQINDGWHAFVRTSVSAVVTQKIEATTLRLKSALAKAQGTIAELKAAGKDVSRLEALYAEADAAVVATQEADLTMKEAVHRLARARVKVVHLVSAVNAVLNDRPVPEVEASEEAQAEASAATAPDGVTVNTEESEEAES